MVVVIRENIYTKCKKVDDEVLMRRENEKKEKSLKLLDAFPPKATVNLQSL